jgi:ornithine carbamoyltransferase
VNALLQLAVTIKHSPEDFTQALKGKSFVGLFEKPSLRTRVSFDIGIQKLGGHFLYLDSHKDNLSGREENKDMAANLSCWSDGIIARVYEHSTLQQLAEFSTVPVINALCDNYHPCQALADFQTVYEQFGRVKGIKLAYIGDGNNVCHSLMIVGAKLGADIVVITPEGREPSSDIVNKAQQIASTTDASILVGTDVQLARGADVLYTDTWQSMGDDTPLDILAQQFNPYQINQQLLDSTGATKVMHCQPAHRDYEITSEVMDSDAAILMQQAENRMYAQCAILITLMESEE